MSLPWPIWTEQEWRDAPIEPRALGGPGSGNFGHAGRPGQIGGSGNKVSYSKEETNVVAEYVGSLDPSPEGVYVSDGFNALLRGVNRYSLQPEPYTSKQEQYYRQQIEKLQKVIEKTKTTKDAVLYRGVDARLSKKLVDGTVFTDKGFTSLTSDRQIAEERFMGFGDERGRVFEVHVPKGTPLLEIEPILNPLNDKEYTTEQEHLLGHGTRFRVKGNVLEVIR